MTSNASEAPPSSITAAEGPPSSLISAPYRTYAMSLLLAIYIVNHLDRQVVNILAEPIKRDLGLADWQLGLMSGLAFAVLYTILGIPIARLAERGHRPFIIATSAAVWSVFTVICGFVQSFGQLVLARVGVGVGEAGCTPPSHSLIVDYAPPEKRSSMLAFYGMGAPLGGLMGMAFGGLVADAYGWRAAFLVAGVPGLIFAVVAALTLKEPRRMMARRAAEIQAASATFRETLALISKKRSLWFLTAGNTLKAFIVYGKAPFIASFFLRNHSDGVAAAAKDFGSVFGLHLQPIGFLGLSIGLLTGIGGALGFWTGGQLSDRVSSRNIRRYMDIAAIGAFMTIPAFLGILTAPSVWIALPLVGVHAFFGGVHYGPTYTIAYTVVPPHMRATTSALMLFVVNLIALGLGPVTVGIVSDLFARTMGEAEGLRWSLLVFGVAPIIATILFIVGGRSLKSDLGR